MRDLRAIGRATLAALSFASAIGLAGCTKVEPQGPASGNAWTRHGRLVYAEPQDTKALNPMLATGVVVGDLSMFVFSYAVRYDDRARPVPDALREIPTVANGDVSPDGLTLKYRLRENIRWQDNVPLTCADLKFTVAAVLNPHNNVITTDGYKDIRDIDCTDPHVALIHMKRVYAPYLQQLWGVNSNAPILPEHLLAKYNDARGSFNDAPYQGMPIGSGPFRVTEWKRGDHVTMKAFDGFYRGRPKLDEVVFRTISDENVMVNEVRTHDIDLAVRGGLSTWPSMQGIVGYVATASPLYLFDHIDFNLHRPIFARDVDLRRALAMAIDREDLRKKVAFGIADLTDTALSPQLSYAYDTRARHYAYDPAGARALLERDGWHLGADGIRSKAGTRLAFSLGTQSEASTGKAIQVQVQRYWHDVGADVSVHNANTAQFFDNTTQGILQGGHYDVALFAWSGAADPDDSAIYSGHNQAPHGQNAMYWDDPVATAAMDAELATVDPAKRLRGFHTEQERFADDVPSIVMWYRREPQLMNTDLKNYRPSPVISPFWNPWDYSL